MNGDWDLPKLHGTISQGDSGGLSIAYSTVSPRFWQGLFNDSEWNVGGGPSWSWVSRYILSTERAEQTSSPPANDGTSEWWDCLLPWVQQKPREGEMLLLQGAGSTTNTEVKSASASFFWLWTWGKSLSLSLRFLTILSPESLQFQCYNSCSMPYCRVLITQRIENDKLLLSLLLLFKIYPSSHDGLFCFVLLESPGLQATWWHLNVEVVDGKGVEEIPQNVSVYSKLLEKEQKASFLPSKSCISP